MAVGKWLGASMMLYAADQYAKEQTEERFCIGEEKELAGGRIVWRRVENRGFALDLLDERPKIVRNGSLAAVLLGGIYGCGTFLRRGHLTEKMGAALVLGGGLSNLYDRLMRGYVVDYIGFRTKWKKLTGITYNFGDLFIFSGMGMLLGSFMKQKKKH